MAPSRQWAQALACALPFAAVLLGQTRESRATDLRLQWIAPTGCPQRAQVEAAIERLLQQRRGGSGQLDAVGVITAVDGGFRLQLDLSREGATNTREVRGATCAALADSAALVVAMAIDPEVVSHPAPGPTPPDATTPSPAPGATPPSPAPGATAPDATAPSPAPGATAPSPASGPTPRSPAATRGARPPAKPTPPSKAIASRRDAPTTPSPAARLERDVSGDPRGASSTGPRWRAWAGFLGDIGTMQSTAGAVELGAGVVLGPARLDASFAYWLPQDAEAESDSTIGGTLGLEAGALSACALLPPLARAAGPRFEIALPCAAIEVGRMHAAASENVTTPEAGSDPWVAVRAGAAAGWAVRPWARIRVRLETAVPIVRPRFVLRNVAGVVHEPGVAGRASLALDLAF